MATPATKSPLYPAVRTQVEGGVVWVLEDSPLEAEMARRAVAANHSVKIFADSPAMLERIANGSRPDTLVLDCQLPTMTGLEVCRFIRESFDEMDLPILMLTVEGHRADLVDGLTAGANDYLTKPYHVAELLARVSTLVRTRLLHAARAARARELALTAEVGALLTRGPDSAAQLCVSAIGQHLDAAVTGIWATGADRPMTLAAFFGAIDSERVAPPKVDTDSLTRVVRFDDSTDAFVDDPRWVGARSRTFVEMPLVVESRVIGALAVGTLRHLGSEEIEAIASLADLVALGIERTRVEHERTVLLAREQRAREEAEAANRGKDEFLAMLSHELRGPLNAIAGWVHMLRSGVVPPADIQRALATIERNTRAQTQLVEDLLDVSRIVSGKLTIEHDLVDLSETVEGVVDSMRPMAAEKKLTLVANVQKVGEVRGDHPRLRQVATNLITNALKFTPAGGTVTVTVRRDARVAVLVVEDTGQGIDAKFLPHVFERFRQADGSTARRHGGLGLGLAIVHHLTELHGGSIAVASEGPGKGATFTLKLPLVTAESNIPESAIRSVVPNEGACNQLSVVVVDDDADARELVAKVLTDSGAQVRIADSVDGGLALIRDRAPDVLVTDLGMPGADGFEFLRRLRELPVAEGGAVPVIAFTAYARPEHRAATVKAGFDAYLTKPLDCEAMIAAVARLGHPQRDIE